MAGTREAGDGTAIGIDLGTTYCAAGVCINGTVQIIPNQGQGVRLTPSYVAFLSNGKTAYGRVAKEQSFKNPKCTIFDAKRMIGRTWDDPTLQKDIFRWPFKMVEVKGAPKIKIGNKTRDPQKVYANLLSAFCRHAEEYLGKDPGSIKKAVITVPAYFSESQRQATIEAGEAAGLQVLTTLTEPIAAGVAYLNQCAANGGRNCLIYDLGGGAFDVSILNVGSTFIQTMGVGGDVNLGGQDFDRLLLDYFAQEFHKQTGIHLLQNKKKFRSSITRLRLQCEVAKLALSSSDSVTVGIQKIYKDVDLNVTVTRSKFEELIKPLLDKTLEIVEHVIKDAYKIKCKDDIDKIILVGGSTGIPMVKSMLQNFFVGKEILSNINPDVVVAHGAAIQASTLATGDFQRHLRVGDLVPVSIGIKMTDSENKNFFQKFIPKYSPYPCTYTGTGFPTTEDNQIAMNFPVYQGESSVATENEILGEFLLEGIPRASKGKEMAEVKMIIDANGILTVTATCTSTRNCSTFQIRDNRLLVERDAIHRFAKNH